MATFAAGKRLTANMLNDALGVSVGDTQDAVGTTTSGTYTATLTGGTACGVVFTAPTSGKVQIFFNALMQNSGANFTYSSPQVKTGSTIGSGTTFLAADDGFALTHNGTAALRYGGSVLVTGLTAGSVYNVQLLHHVTAGTGTTSRKRLSVSPQAG